MTQTSVRPGPDVPFFLQLASSTRAWMLGPVFAALKPAIRRYDARYSTDALVRIDIFEFDNIETFNAWMTSIEVKIRDRFMEMHNFTHHITVSVEIDNMTEEEAEEHRKKIAETTWPKSCMIINVVEDFGPDRLRPNATKPENDHIALEPSYLAA